MRNVIYYLIKNIKPGDATEKKRITQTLSWIESGAPIFRTAKPNIPHKHFAAYCVLYDSIHKKILLTDHKIAGRWIPAGGHVEPDEHPKTTIKRELAEELGINACFLLDTPLYLSVTRATQKYHIDVTLWYLLAGDSTTPLAYDPVEFDDARWFDLDEIPFQSADPNLRRFVAKLKTKDLPPHPEPRLYR